MADRSPNFAGARVTGRRDPEETGEPTPDFDELALARQAEENFTRVEALVGRLSALAQEQVGRKQTIEDRWLRDLRQYNGRYDAGIEANLASSNKSRMFVNLTRPKTHAWEARLSDMLFPADQNNWGIKATPQPDMEMIVSHDQPEDPNMDTIDPLAGGEGAAVPEDSPEVKAAKQGIDEAKRRADAMESEINDQLVEARYPSRMRTILHDACQLGTGICKGPTLTNKTRRRWRRVQQENGPVLDVLETVQDPKPDMVRVDPWQFFPDMTATCMEEAGFAFERHLFTPKQVRTLAKQPGFDLDALRQLLIEGPHEAYPSYIPNLREITGAGQETLKERFHVWEYHGPIERDDLEAVLSAGGRDEELDDYDPLEEINVVVWFCQGHLLKFAEQPMESGDLLYSVFNFEKDDTGMFGFGVPYLMQDSQAALNGAWRMIMDNGALSAGPQVIIDTLSIEPADGSWDLTPRKVWKRTKAQQPQTGPAFEVANIPNNQAELTNIVTMAMRFADDETSLPVIHQYGEGKDGSHVARTAMGMAMLMNAVNVVFRRVVKNFDDDMTVPNIRRMYDWNMQFSPKDHIKGDYDVDARGSSVLLVREIQAQNLMVMAERYTGHPVLGPMTRAASLYRKTIEAHMLNPNDFVMTDEEIKAEQQKRAAQGEQDPEIIKLQAQQQIAQLESQTRLQVAEMEVQAKLIQLAESSNMSLDKLEAILMKERMSIDSKERLFAGEAAMEERKAAAGDFKGGGGYL